MCPGSNPAVRALEALWAVESIADVNHLTRLMCGQ
jgi:hypothetical protein